MGLGGSARRAPYPPIIPVATTATYLIWVPCWVSPKKVPMADTSKSVVASAVGDNGRWGGAGDCRHLPTIPIIGKISSGQCPMRGVCLYRTRTPPPPSQYFNWHPSQFVWLLRTRWFESLTFFVGTLKCYGWRGVGGRGPVASAVVIVCLHHLRRLLPPSLKSSKSPPPLHHSCRC
jgi:hypothetical protein